MKVFFSAILLAGVAAIAALCYFFKYPVEIAMYHLFALSILCAIVATFLFVIKYLFKKKTAYVIANTMALFFWLFISFFYPIILGSNYFWGNTITFNILKKYLVSLDSILTILPVEKWILVSILVVYLLLALGIFYLIRLRRSLFEKPPGPLISPSRRKYFLIGGLVLLVGIFFSRHLIMDLKRRMHFKQEPLIYFCLGPMWKTHSDEFNISGNTGSPQDKQCIAAIKRSAPKDKLAIIILLDALRSDHLPMYGYNRMTAPFLDSLYRNNQLIKVRNSFSTSVNTIGGVSGLFYSKDWKNFDFSELSLMQYFQLSGYSTSAFLTGYHSGWYGLSAMYRQYCDNFYESTSAYNAATDDDLITLEKIKSTKFSTGSFIYIHLLSTHMVGKKNESFRVFTPDKIGMSVGEKEAFTNNYDNGVLQGDYVLRQLFSKLQTDGMLDKVTLFIVGDHGDLMGESGEFGHSGGVHEKLLEVPILIYDKDPSWYKQTTIATLADIGPSLTDRIFGQVPACWQGRSLHRNPPAIYSARVSSSTTKSEFSEGLLSMKNDTVRLSIFNDHHILQRESIKIDSVNWKTTFSLH